MILLHSGEEKADEDEDTCLFFSSFFIDINNPDRSRHGDVNQEKYEERFHTVFVTEYHLLPLRQIIGIENCVIGVLNVGVQFHKGGALL